MRHRLGQLEEIMRRHRCCGLIIRHLAKNRNPVTLMQGSGSIGFIAHVRLGLRVFDDPVDPNRRVLAQIKTNVGREAFPLLFQVDASFEDERPYVEWRGPVDYTLGELAGPTPTGSGKNEPSTRQEVLELLQERYPEVVTTQKIAEEFPDLDRGTLRMTLKRLVDDGLLQKVERGQYVALTGNS